MNFWIVSPVRVYCDIHFKTLNIIFAIRYIFPLVLRDDWQLVVSCLSGLMTSSCESTRWMYGTWPTAELSRLWRRPARWFASMSVEENLCVKKWWRSSWWKDPKVPVSELNVSWWKQLLWYGLCLLRTWSESFRAPYSFRQECDSCNIPKYASVYFCGLTACFTDPSVTTM